MRVAYCLTHPIQYQSPLIRYLVAAGVDLELVYATDITASGYLDRGFGRAVEWDVPLVDGYPYRVLFPGSQIPSGLKGFGRFQSAIITSLIDSAAEVVWVHGWGNAYPLAAMRAARQLGLPVLMRGETSLDCLRGGVLRRAIHRNVLSMLFNRVSQFLAVGTANREFYLAHGVLKSKIHSAPYVVDNAFFQARCHEAAPNRERLRQQLGIESGRPIILFCGKLISVKDPATLIRAVGMAAGLRPMLLLAGDGVLRAELKALADDIAPGLVKFLGFCNQTELPAYYDLCDLFVLPSPFEPWGLVVNEVMNAGRPVIVSDKVGAGYDLVRPGLNGDIFTAGDARDLYRRMVPWLEGRSKREDAGGESLRIINQWGFPENLAGLRNALAKLSE